MKIVYEDNDVVAIDKPAGTIVNRADTTRHETTVQDWAEEYLQVARVPRVAQVARAESHETRDTRDTFYDRGGIVHRLDKETSGILLIAKNPAAFAELQRQFKERTVKKTYLALTHGKVIPSEGEINVPVGRLPWNRKQFGVVAGGREALTRYRTINNLQLTVNNHEEQVTLLELYPETGRTHQIRVHLKYIGFPIFGDYLYAGRKTQRDDRKLLSRVFLHAAKISFEQPTSHEKITIECELPEELIAILDQTV